MRFVLRVAGAALGLGVMGLVALLVGARFADGPMGIVAGGPFRSGEMVSGQEPDWSFVRDVREVEFQLLDPPRSRTTWILAWSTQARSTSPAATWTRPGDGSGSSGRSRSKGTGAPSCASGMRSTSASSCASETGRCWHPCWRSSAGSISGGVQCLPRRSSPVRSGSSSSSRDAEAEHVRTQGRARRQEAPPHLT